MLPVIAEMGAGRPQTSAFASRETESLRTQTVDYDLYLRSADGREVSVSLDLSSLQYQRTYTAAGMIHGPGGGRGAEARVAAASEGLQQAAVYHEQQSLDYSRLDLQIEGDISLLQEHFGSEDTAQRIFDHVSGLLGIMGADSDGFDDAVAQITQGVADGFAQAEAMLGMPLPDVSTDTRTLLDAMLADLANTGSRGLQASDYLGLLTPDDKDAAAE